MPLLTFEDFCPGDIRTFGVQTVSRDSIIAFAREFDPQPFHLDNSAAQKSMLGGLSASGWQTACLLMRMACDGWVNHSASWGGSGMDELKWLAPVRAGDVLSAKMQVMAVRASKSRPEMGLVSVLSHVLNQRGETVMSQANTVMIGRRGMALARRALPPRIRKNLPAADPGLPAIWFEDTEIERKIPLGQYVFTRENIIAFAAKYDPQPFHLDETAGENSHFGGLVASGWHTACASMRMLVDARHAHVAQMLARGETVADGGPSPGVRDMAWSQPVRPGDVIAYATTCTGKRPVSRPGWGLVEARNTGTNQNGDEIFAFTSNVFVPMRG